MAGHRWCRGSRPRLLAHPLYGSCHCWLLPPLQAHSTSWVPFVVLNAGSSRHLPDYASYNGPLYQVKRASDGATTNISTLSAGGYANSAAQDSFCAGTTCTITEIFDQSPQHNNIAPEPAGPRKPGIDVIVSAAKGRVKRASPVVGPAPPACGLSARPGVGSDASGKGVRFSVRAGGRIAPDHWTLHRAGQYRLRPALWHDRLMLQLLGFIIDAR